MRVLGVLAFGRVALVGTSVLSFRLGVTSVACGFEVGCCLTAY
jgi:hypothetical protein